jgi:hypothetical protein
MLNTRTAGRVSSVAAAMIAAAVLVAGATAPAYAADPTTEAPAKATTKAGNETRICVKDATSTGTRLPRKICMTRGEWIARTGSDPTEQK